MVVALDLPPQIPFADQVASGYAHVISFPAEMFDRYVVFKGSGGDIDLGLSFDSTAGTVYLANSTQAPLTIWIRTVESAFGLNKRELADVLKTTRKTVYNWLDGTTQPHQRNLKRIFDLAVIASDWRDSGFTSARHQVIKSVVDNRSVLDLLVHEQLDRDQILFAGSRLTLESGNSLDDPFA